MVFISDGNSEVCLWLKLFFQLQFKKSNCHSDDIFHHMFGCDIFRSLNEVNQVLVAWSL